jgi:glycosyltransferase involved in cell wall biosynthesis
LTIPKSMHFVFGLREQAEPFHLVHYLCIESCRRVVKPATIFLHCKHLPYGRYWELVSEHLTVVRVDHAEEVSRATYDDNLVPQQFRYAHHSDFVRLDALIEHGGMYADIDTLFVHEFPEKWFEQPFVIGREAAVRDEHTGEVRPSLCNALLMSEKGSEFAQIWRNEMEAALNGSWSNHSTLLPHELSLRIPEAVHVEPIRSFFEYGASRDGIERLFEDAETDLERVFSIHLWSHLWWDENRTDFSHVHAGEFTEERIRALDTTYNLAARTHLPRQREAATSRARNCVEYISIDEDSGYGIAARRLILALEEAEVNVQWAPYVDTPNSAFGYGPAPAGYASRSEIAHLAGRDQVPDTVVAHLVPEYYPQIRDRYPATRLIGHTVWETDRLPRHWPDLLEIPDLVVVPCEWNAEVIREAGVSTPVEVVPHVLAELAAPAQVSSAIPDVPDDTTVFYTIATWTTRKALTETIRAFLTAFTQDDPVVLIVKTTHQDFADTRPCQANLAGAIGPGTTAWTLAGILAEFPASAAVHLVTRDLSNGEISALHARGDCFVSLSRSEGWGIPAFDAATAGNPVVITGYGGHLDYLDDATAYIVDYESVEVRDPWGALSYTPDQHWAEASIEHAATLMRRVADDPAEAAARGRAASDNIHRDFSPAVIAERFVRATSVQDGSRSQRARPTRWSRLRARLS